MNYTVALVTYDCDFIIQLSDCFIFSSSQKSNKINQAVLLQ